MTASNNRKYYSLLIADGALNEEPNIGWSVQFGDFSKKVVEQERVDSFRSVPKKYTKIICTNGTQKEIDATVAILNGRKMEYRLGSSSMVSAPGIVRWAINGASFPKDVEAMARVIAETWSLPSIAAERLVTKKVPFTIDGEAVVFTVNA